MLPQLRKFPSRKTANPSRASFKSGLKPTFYAVFTSRTGVSRLTATQRAANAQAQVLLPANTVADGSGSNGSLQNSGF